jgi:Tannase and feruloyl esterase
MDATDPDLRPFAARGGKLIMLEYTSDYAQSPWAGIEYHQSVQKRLGAAATDAFMRLYTAPGVDHVGAGAPGNVDMLAVLSQWVEQGKAPAALEVVSQPTAPPFAVSDARPLCRWPAWPRYRGSGDPKLAASFECARR